MKDLNSIWAESQVNNEEQVNKFVFEAIRNGELDLDTFIEYQEITQGEVEECLEDACGE